MKKRINIEGVLNELRGGSAFFPNYKNDETNSRSEKDEIQDVEGTEAPENKQPPLPSREEDKAFKVAHYNTVDQSVNRSINQSTDQSTSQPTIPLKPNSVSSNIVGRPKAFYITVRLDKSLDQAVRYFQDVHGIRKADRSTVINAMLDIEDNWSDEALDRLVSRLISQLTSRLTGK